MEKNEMDFDAAGKAHYGEVEWALMEREKNSRFQEGTRVRITNVDMHGFNGREKHPEPSDVGAEGEVVMTKAIDARMFPDEDLEAEGSVFEVVTIVVGSHATRNRRVLEMMDFEIEVVS